MVSIALHPFSQQKSADSDGDVPYRNRGRERREQLPKWIRRTERGKLFHLRPYTGPVKTVYAVNFGCYPSLYEAVRVKKVLLSVWRPGVDVWTALLALIASGDVSPRLTSRWVYVTAGGYGVRAMSRGRAVHLPGPFATPALARDAAREAIKLLPAV